MSFVSIWASVTAPIPELRKLTYDILQEHDSAYLMLPDLAYTSKMSYVSLRASDTVPFSELRKETYDILQEYDSA